MKILRMQATFGKLDGDVLELQPGLNVITAPNESGKSTWCAFLLAMLYGVDTAQRSSRDSIADKTKYQPWSGKPMAGRIDLEWQARRITIERATRGRVPMADFRAYETDSGAPVAELNAQNCGQVLTGTARNVFIRSAFLQQADHVVTFDALLEQQLQELVTTSDENVSFQQAKQQLTQLQNRCRHHKTGLIPETESALSQVKQTLLQMDMLQTQMQELEAAFNQQKAYQLSQQASREEQSRQALEKARHQAEDSKTAYETLQTELGKLPTDAQLETWQTRLQQLDQTSPLGNTPELQAPAALQDLTPPQAAQVARQDSQMAQELEAQRPPRIWPRLAPLLLLVGVAFWRQSLQAALLCGGIGFGLTILLLLVWLHQNRVFQRKREKLEQLLALYQAADAEDIMQQARSYLRQLRMVQEQARQPSRGEQAELLKEISGYFPVQQPSDALEQIHQARMDYLRLQTAARQAENDRQHYLQLQSAVTAAAVAGDGPQVQQLTQQLAAIQGKLEILGQRTVLEEKKQSLTQRLTRLLQYYEAVTAALEALQQASDTLQARFAPPLKRLTAQYLALLTDSAHDQITIDRQLQLQLQDAEHPISRPSGYYSVGTRDQIYLALRLAIAELLLCPGAPYILDDALVCFDNHRLRQALKLLQKLSGEHQILLFSCQNREEDLLQELTAAT